MILLITTCGSRSSRYFGRLVQQVNNGGWRGPHLIISDGPPSLITGWPTSASRTREGQKATYWRALAVGLEAARKTGDDRILVLEDDVELCRNALQYMNRARLPSVLDFVTWFDGHMVPKGAAEGIYPMYAQQFFCLQGVTWRTSTAERLLHAPAAAAWPELHSGDILIAKILNGRRYGVHVPNLVQHLGAESVCNPGQKLSGVRIANNYRGSQFDAMTLGRRRTNQAIVRL
jgi:hypothetical protein